MKQFFKFLLASFLGSALLLIVLFFLGFGALLNSTTNTANIRPNSLLYMDLNYNIPDRTCEDNITNTLRGFNSESNDMSGMNDIISNIKAAAKDPNISGIFLELSSIGTSTANIEEIRNELLRFRESGKFVITYSENMSQGAYFLATAGDEIYINPAGMLDIHGMASQVIFYKKLLDKLDIEMQIVRGPNNPLSLIS